LPDQRHRALQAEKCKFFCPERSVQKNTSLTMTNVPRERIAPLFAVAADVSSCARLSQGSLSPPITSEILVPETGSTGAGFWRINAREMIVFPYAHGDESM
jgi:hypothetical protein